MTAWTVEYRPNCDTKRYISYQYNYVEPFYSNILQKA